MDQDILITGATGKTGRRVVERLRAQNVAHRAASRNSEHRFEWNEPETWGPALRGTRAAYVVFYPDLAVPGASDAITAFCETARRENVTHLVLLSGRGEPEAQKCEQIVMDSGLDWTVVRCSWFMQNFSESFLIDGVQQRHIVLPVEGVLEPFVDVEDIADVVTAALTDAKHANKLYELTGPRLMTFPECAAEIGAALGETIAYQAVPNDVYSAGMREAGLPEEVAGLVDYLFQEVLDGRNSRLSNGVAAALGREPRDFHDYIQRTVGTGAWAKQPHNHPQPV